MTVLVTIVVAALVLAFIAYPLFRQGSRRIPAELVEDEQLQELQTKRDSTYSAIKELEFDFKSGALSAEDYHDLETSYERKAISVLRDMDELENGRGVEGGVEDEIERQVLRLRQARGLFCPQCGAQCSEGDKFCSHCGTRLAQRRSG